MCPQENSNNFTLKLTYNLNNLTYKISELIPTISLKILDFEKIKYAKAGTSTWNILKIPKMYVTDGNKLALAKYTNTNLFPALTYTTQTFKTFVTMVVLSTNEELEVQIYT